MTISATGTRRRTWLAAGSLACVWPWVGAQTGRHVRLVVPFTLGGSTDILARALAPKLAAALGQNVIIDNKPGAGGSLGATEVARAEADGQTLLMGHIGTLAVNPSIYSKLAYDPMKSFTAVAWVARVPNVLVVNAQSPTRTLTEFVERAKSMPGQLSYSSGGNGSAAHITFEYLRMASSPLLASQPRRWRGSTPKSTRRSPCPR